VQHKPYYTIGTLTLPYKNEKNFRSADSLAGFPTNRESIYSNKTTRKQGADGVGIVQARLEQ
jgi:hypothetical protein